MKWAGMLGALLLVACASDRAPTYRELERRAADYERGGVSPLAAPQDAEEATARDTCGASAYRSLVGAPVAGAQIPATARIIAPGAAVTEDFRSNRINIITNESGVITALRCY